MVENGPQGSSSCMSDVTLQCWELTQETCTSAAMLGMGWPGLP